MPCLPCSSPSTWTMTFVLLGAFRRTCSVATKVAMQANLEPHTRLHCGHLGPVAGAQTTGANTSPCISVSCKLFQLWDRSKEYNKVDHIPLASIGGCSSPVYQLTDHWRGSSIIWKHTCLNISNHRLALLWLLVIVAPDINVFTITNSPLPQRWPSSGLILCKNHCKNQFAAGFRPAPAWELTALPPPRNLTPTLGRLELKMRP